MSTPGSLSYEPSSDQWHKCILGVREFFYEYFDSEMAIAMGIDWMKNRDELSEAIPPAYSRYIGEQFNAQR
jgi:hypothetical protein